jgi:hypothetical protein
MLIDKLFKGRRAPIELALDLTTESVVLFERREDQPWTPVGEAVLGVPDFKKQIDALRVEALVRDRDRSPVRLWLPPEQVLLREMTLVEQSAGPAKAEALRQLEQEGSYRSDELMIALGPVTAGKPRTVLAVMSQTVHEAMDYSAKWGFQPGAVSTRAHADKFVDSEPIFHGADSLTKKAGRAAAHSAIALAALAAVGLAGIGVYHMSAPVLAPPTTVNSTASIAPPAIATRSDGFGSTAPLGATRVSFAQTLGLRGVSIPGAPPSLDTEMSAYAEPRLSPPIPEISAPDLTALLQVGPTSAEPQWSRPARLNRDVPENERASIAALQDTGIEPGFGAAQPNGGETQDEVITAAVNPTAGDLPSADSVLSPQNADPTSADADAQGQTAAIAPDQTVETEDDEFAPTDRAPKEMADAPLPRPAGLAPPESQTLKAAVETPVARPKLATEEAAVAETSQTASAEPAPPTPAPEDAQADITTKPVETDEPTALAAVTAPKPVTRPLSLRNLTPSFERPRTRARDKAPQSVRVAARERGLSLSKTSLIGVIDARSGRQALVRLPNGDFRKVGRGDVLDGWRVSTIGRETLKLTKRGQNRTLLLVSR